MMNMLVRTAVKTEQTQPSKMLVSAPRFVLCF